MVPQFHEAEEARAAAAKEAEERQHEMELWRQPKLSRTCLKRRKMQRRRNVAPKSPQWTRHRDPSRVWSPWSRCPWSAQVSWACEASGGAEVTEDLVFPSTQVYREPKNQKQIIGVRVHVGARDVPFLVSQSVTARLKQSPQVDDDIRH